MNFITGWLIGNQIGAFGGELAHRIMNCIFYVILLIAIAFLGAYGAVKNFGEEYRSIGFISPVVSILLFCCYRPLNSTFKTNMLSGIYMANRITFGFNMLMLIFVVGYWILSGEMKKEGLAGAANLFSGDVLKWCKFVVFCFLANLLISFIFYRDHLRLNQAEEI